MMFENRKHLNLIKRDEQTYSILNQAEKKAGFLINLSQLI
jgi:hypothetical protein